MAFKMYKGDAECVADMEQLAVMTNAGWSRKQEVPAPKKAVKKVVKKEAPVETSEEVTEGPLVAKTAPKKAAPKKRRSTKK